LSFWFNDMFGRPVDINAFVIELMLEWVNEWKRLFLVLNSTDWRKENDWHSGCLMPSAPKGWFGRPPDNPNRACELFNSTRR
jgi:hypothetical protein